MRINLVLFFVLAFIFVQCGTKNSATGEIVSKPNILFIHIDDLGYHDLSVHGSQIYQTPEIDKLASQSISFTNAYASYPRCVPSRYAMATGMYPIQNGDVPDDGFQLENISDAKNFIKILNKANYNTAYIGKWHLGEKEYGPMSFGYDFSFAAGKAGSPISFLYPYNTPKGNNKKVKKALMLDIEEQSKEGDYLTDKLTEAAIEYIDTISKEQPFMLSLAYYAVHQPLEAKQEDIERNRNEIENFDFGEQPKYIPEGTGRRKMRQDNANYAAMVENLDVNVGLLLKKLEDLGLAMNTIVVFSSDHGGLSNEGFNKRGLATTNYPLRAGKGWLYEGGIKVPLFIKWPNKITPKVESESLVSLFDMFPTFIDLAGEDSIRNVDGKSLTPILFDEKQWTNRTLFWHSSKARPHSTGERKTSAVRKGDWKLLDFYEEGRIELYNIANDQGENSDVSLQEVAKKDELLELLNNWKATFKN